MGDVMSLISKVAATSSNVLVMGESGTGKELVARALHNRSLRKNYPFVAINCAAIPAELMEAELFGHEKGAFTGAHKKTIGKFEYAQKGTIFLDEISCLKSEFQAKLLRFVQEREFTRIGSHRAIKVDVRIIAATNNSLVEMVEQGTFRDDLYFRLNVVPILLPPLQSRKGGIPLLSDYFLDKFNYRMNKNVKGFTPDAIAMLEAHTWPGNIRELENLIERMVVMGSDNEFIDKKDLSLDWLFYGQNENDTQEKKGKGSGLIMARESFERGYIQRALKNCRWNQTMAAQYLGIHRNTLIRKMKSLNLTKELQ